MSEGLPRGRGLPPAQQASTGLGVTPLVYQPTISIPGNQHGRPSVLVTNRPVMILENSLLSRVLGHGLQDSPFRPGTRAVYSEFLGLSFPASRGNQRRELVSVPIPMQRPLPSQEESHMPLALLAPSYSSSDLLTSVVPYSMSDCATGYLVQTSPDAGIHSDGDIHRTSLDHPAIHETCDFEVPPLGCNERLFSEATLLSTEQDKVQSNIPTSPRVCLSHASDTIQQGEASTQEVLENKLSSTQNVTPHHSQSLKTETDESLVSIPESPPNEHFTHTPHSQLPILHNTDLRDLNTATATVTEEHSLTFGSQEKITPLHTGHADTVIELTQPKPSLSNVPIPSPTLPVAQPIPSSQEALASQTIASESPKSAYSPPPVCSLESLRCESPQLVSSLNSQQACLPASSDTDIPKQIMGCLPQQEDTSNLVFLDCLSSSDGTLMPADSCGTTVIIGSPESISPLPVLISPEEATASLSDCNPPVHSPNTTRVHTKPLEEPLAVDNKSLVPEQAEQLGDSSSLTSSSPNQIETYKLATDPDQGAVSFHEESEGGSGKDTHSMQLLIGERVLKTWAEAIVTLSKCNEGMNKAECEEKEERMTAVSQIQHPDISDAPQCQHPQMESIPECVSSSQHLKQAEESTLLLPAQLAGEGFNRAKDHKGQSADEERKEQPLKATPHSLLNPSKVVLACEEREDQTLFESDSELEMDIDLEEPETNSSSPNNVVPDLRKEGYSLSPSDDTALVPSPCPLPLSSSPVPQPQKVSGKDGGLRAWHFSFPSANTLLQKSVQYGENFSLGKSFMPSLPSHPPTFLPCPPTSPPHPPTPPPHPPTPPPHPHTPPLSSTTIANCTGQRARIKIKLNQQVSNTQPNRVRTLLNSLGQSLVPNKISLQEPLPKKIKLAPSAESTCCYSESAHLGTRGGECQDQCPEMLWSVSSLRQESEQPTASHGSTTPGPSPSGHNEHLMSTGGATVPEHTQTHCHGTEDEHLMVGCVDIHEPRNDADDGLDTVCQEVPRENSREHALVPNMVSCQSGDGRNSQDDSDDHCGSGAVVPVASSNLTQQVPRISVQGSDCNQTESNAEAEDCEGLAATVIPSEQSFCVAAARDNDSTLSQYEGKDSIGTTEPPTHTAIDASVTANFRAKCDQQIVPESSFNDSFNTSGFYEEQGEEKEAKSKPLRLEDMNIDELDGPTALAIVLESLDNRGALSNTEEVKEDMGEGKDHNGGSGVVSKQKSPAQSRSQCQEWSSVFHSRGLDRGHPQDKQVSFSNNEVVKTTRLNLSRPRLRLGLSRKQSCLPLHTTVEANMKDRHQ